MINQTPPSGFVGILIILATLVGVVGIYRYFRTRYDALPKTPRGHVLGDLQLVEGDNWQTCCPDCGAFNVFHRPAGVACRGCGHELLFAPVPATQGGTPGEWGVISVATHTGGGRVLYCQVGRGTPSPALRAMWSHVIFQDLPAPDLVVDPATDLDWPEVELFMPVLCPSCQGALVADCTDCQRTGARYVPLTSWRGGAHRKLSRSAMSQLRYSYAKRTGLGADVAVVAFDLLTTQAKSGFGAIVLEGRRERAAMPPAGGPASALMKDGTLEEAVEVSRRTVAAAPRSPAPRSVRDGERPLGGYQPLPNYDGEALRRPPRKP